jgi:hypothetical protein
VIDEEFSKLGGIWIMSSRATGWWPSFGRIRRTATWPFARLRADSSQVTISSPFGRFVVTPQNLVSITRMSGITSSGLRFEVNDSTDAAVFWTSASGVDAIVDELRLRSWEIHE